MVGLADTRGGTPTAHVIFGAGRVLADSVVLSPKGKTGALQQEHVVVAEQGIADSVLVDVVPMVMVPVVSVTVGSTVKVKKS